MRGSETFSKLVAVQIGNRNEIQELFKEGKLDIYLEIPEDFAQNMIRIQHSPVQVYLNIEDTTKAILFENILHSYEKYIKAVEVNAVGLYEIMEQKGMDQELIDKTNQRVSIDLIFTALGKEEFFSFHTVEAFPATNVFLYYLISILLMFLLYGGLYAGFQVLKEFQYQTYMRLKTTKTPAFYLIGIKTCLLSMIFTCIIAAFFYRLKGGEDVAYWFLYDIAISVFSVSFAVFLSVIMQTMQRYILIGNLLLFYFIVIGGGIIPIQFLPQGLIRLARITPFYYMLQGMILIVKGQVEAVRGILVGFFVCFACFMCYGSSRVEI